MTGMFQTNVVAQVGDELRIARATLKWMIAHRAYWDTRAQTLLEPVSFLGRHPQTAAPDKVLAYLHGLDVEISRDAGAAG